MDAIASTTSDCAIAVVPRYLSSMAFMCSLAVLTGRVTSDKSSDEVLSVSPFVGVFTDSSGADANALSGIIPKSIVRQSIVATSLLRLLLLILVPPENNFLYLFYFIQSTNLGFFAFESVLDRDKNGSAKMKYAKYPASILIEAL